MKYNFDEVIDRSQNRSSKYDERVKKFGTADVIPLWVADMDFRTAQPVIDACVKKAQEGIWGYTSRPDSYFEAVQEWEVKRNNWKPDISLMSWSLGVVPALSAIVKLFSKDGDKIMIQTPVYSEFYDVVEAGQVEGFGSGNTGNYMIRDFRRNAGSNSVMLSMENQIGMNLIGNQQGIIGNTDFRHPAQVGRIPDQS